MSAPTTSDNAILNPWKDPTAKNQMRDSTERTIKGWIDDGATVEELFSEVSDEMPIADDRPSFTKDRAAATRAYVANWVHENCGEISPAAVENYIARREAV